MENLILKKMYLSKGYDILYYEKFKCFFEDEVWWGMIPHEAFDASRKYMDYLNEQIALGHGPEWSSRYAQHRMCSPFFDIRNNILVKELLLGIYGDERRRELEIFVKEFNEESIFEYAYIEAWMHDTNSALKGMEVYWFAKDFTRQYHELINEGHSDDVVKQWLWRHSAIV